MQRLEAHHQAHPSEWILGRGWDQNDWDIKTFPDKELLDKQYPEIPVLLTRIDGHAVLVNSEAMHRAAITEDSDIPAGEAIKNQHGFTGVFLENTADKLRAVVPVPDREQQERALIEAQENCFSVGLTSVTDAGLEKPVVDLIDSLQQQGKLKMQMDVMLLPDKENIESFVKKGPYKTNRLHIHAIKLFADGALGSRGACLIAPYADDPANYGMIVQPKSHYRELFRLAYKYNYQVNTHAIGDSAVRFLLKEYGEVLQEKNDRRWRIEHSQVVHPDDMHLYGEYNIIPSVQTTHATSDMYWADERLGTERIKTAYAYRELLEQNGWLINGTDFPIEDIDPLKTFYAGVFRKDAKGYPAEGFQMENALTRQQTLKSMTIWAAKGSFEENEKGSIEVGKKADFVVLNQDIMEVGEKAILETKVVSTYLNGEAVYQNDTFLQ
jgi:hypothetical protein